MFQDIITRTRIQNRHLEILYYWPPWSSRATSVVIPASLLFTFRITKKKRESVHQSNVAWINIGTKGLTKSITFLFTSSSTEMSLYLFFYNETFFSRTKLNVFSYPSSFHNRNRKVEKRLRHLLYLFQIFRFLLKTSRTKKYLILHPAFCMPWNAFQHNKVDTHYPHQTIVQISSMDQIFLNYHIPKHTLEFKTRKTFLIPLHQHQPRILDITY